VAVIHPPRQAAWRRPLVEVVRRDWRYPRITKSHCSCQGPDTHKPLDGGPDARPRSCPALANLTDRSNHACYEQ